MTIHTVAANRLTSDQIAAWDAFQRGNRQLNSPYFRPEFTQAVAAVRDDVEVAVLEAERQPVAFFPFQRSASSIGRPVGGRLSDFQAMIAPQGFACDPLELVRACQLSVWHFDHLLTSQMFFAPFVWRQADSVYTDLSEGFDAYAAKLRSSSRCDRKRRKLERTVGPVRFEPCVTDRAILSKLLEWKGAQFRRTNRKNVFDSRWIRNLMDKLFEFQSADFSPLLSVLYAGNEVAAINLALRSGNVLHMWFPVYNGSMAQYSPGILLFIEILRVAAAFGIRRVDWGKGPERFKRTFMTGAERVAEGSVDLHTGPAIARRAWWWTRERIRSSPLYGPARASTCMVYRVKNWFEPS